MIVIVDNSDQFEGTVYFVEAPSAEAVEKILSEYRSQLRNGEDSRVVGTTEKIDWRDDADSDNYIKWFSRQTLEGFRELCKTLWL